LLIWSSPQLFPKLWIGKLHHLVICGIPPDAGLPGYIIT